MFQKIVERHEQKGDKLKDVRLIEGAVEGRLPSLTNSNSDRNTIPVVQQVVQEMEEVDEEEEEEEEDDDDEAYLRHQAKELKNDKKMKAKLERMNKEVDATLRDIDANMKSFFYNEEEEEEEDVDEVIAEYTYEDLNLDEPDLEHVDVIQDYDVNKENIIEKEEHIMKEEMQNIKEEQVYRRLQDIEEEEEEEASLPPPTSKGKRKLPGIDKSNIIGKRRLRA